MPSFNQWIQSFKTFSIQEKILFLIFLALFVSSLIFLLNSFYNKNTVSLPTFGGVYKEGLVGQPKHLNPIYSSLSDVDKDLVELLFSGLMKYDLEGNVVPDLIETYSYDNDGKTLYFKIKENILWQDKKPLTIDDVVFTVNIIQDSEYLSPLRASFQGVTIEKISETEAKFELLNPYSSFLENLVNLKIIPQHIWENVLAQDFSSNEKLNLLNPIGSGPYLVDKVKKNGTIYSIYLKRNENFFGQKPYINQLVFTFYANEEELEKAFLENKIDGIGISSSSLNQEAYQYQTPNYFGIFINTKNEILENEEIRNALALAVDRKNISESVNAIYSPSPILPSFYGTTETEVEYNPEKSIEILADNDFVIENDVLVKKVETINSEGINIDLKKGDEGRVVEKLQECLAQDSEVYPDGTVSGYFGENTKQAVILFQEKYADEILTPNNLTAGNGIVKASTREKLNELCYPSEAEPEYLEFTLKTLDYETLSNVAEQIKENLASIGIKINIEKYNSTDIKKIIRERDYDLLLFGEKLGAIADPLPYWHSSQIFDPGLNLSLWTNEDADKLLEEIRSYYDSENEERTTNLSDFETLFLEENPAILIYSPFYNYYINKVQGIKEGKLINPSQRFTDIENWYLKTKKQWK